MNYHGMLVADDGRVDVGRLVHPRVESEVAFPLGRPLGAGAEAVAAVASALEVIDSRYEAFRFDLHEVVADNTSAAGYAAGPWREPVGLTDLAVLLEIDGPVVRTGSTEAILGHPLRALEAAARLAIEAGMTLEPGSTILACAATAAVPLGPGNRARGSRRTGGAEAACRAVGDTAFGELVAVLFDIGAAALAVRARAVDAGTGARPGADHGSGGVKLSAARRPPLPSARRSANPGASEPF
ncbi:hypothetical protein ABZV67_40640 [Streptomyces sp. NPDC005065]|uniref:hypothetical protein n=1 Tax=Streptomyces sp. NPDC005065 TaxID=3154461 RepID=UPI0033BD97BD